MHFSYVFKLSIPIFMGYFPLGVAFGILAKSMGVSAFIAITLSTLAYGGAAQFMMLSLFSAGTGLLEVFIVSYLVNLRHTFYGLALLKEYKDLKFRLFNIATLTDETFAIFKALKIADAAERSYVFTRLNLLSWLYWAAGTAVGCLAGELIRVDTSGLEFSLTALFIVIVMEMFKNDKNYKVLGAACFFGVAGVALMPAKAMLVGSMALCFIFILVFKDKL
ncbi:branched-chain amino acid transport protein, AzlC family [Campylobacter showae]|uniref:Putative azaleucine resistance protein AzlC n=1 Tax=Campylobacter showae RM3277 TaxID=553219 RepID=C6RFM3_9BACT|nr:AzlC family ABC transporter permease [Campylobacter showae]EET80031.1 putative azaleucine resistance protein AzlC [Campylobacter showae RM3277]QCD48780.1 branched-chain amino acid transport protein, AzlC family [Campylobacter showae]